MYLRPGPRKSALFLWVVQGHSVTKTGPRALRASAQRAPSSGTTCCCILPEESVAVRSLAPSAADRAERSEGPHTISWISGPRARSMSPSLSLARSAAHPLGAYVWHRCQLSFFAALSLRWCRLCIGENETIRLLQARIFVRQRVWVCAGDAPDRGLYVRS